MGFLIHDPRQWLQTPSFVDSSNLSQEPSPVPTQEDPNSPEAFRKKIMQEIANRQQQPPPQDVQQILMDLISKRRPPEEEARLRQLRSERPEDIQARMRQSLLGAPATSKLGKFGQTALEIAANAFGVMPNTNKAALEQYKAQQAAANSEESIDQRMTAAQANAISAMQRVRQQADAADEKNKVAVFGKLMDDEAKRRLAAISAIDADSKKDLRAKQAAKLQVDMDMAEKFGTLKALGGLKGGFQLQQIEEILGKEAAQRVAQAEEATQSVKNSSRNRDAQSIPTTSPIISKDADGNTQILGTKTSLRTIPRVDAGDQNALTKMFGLPPRMPEGQQQAPQAGGIPQLAPTSPVTPPFVPGQPMAQRRPNIQPTQQMAAAAVDPNDEFAQTRRNIKRSYPIGNVIGGQGLEVRAVPNNADLMMAQPNPPKQSTEEKTQNAFFAKQNTNLVELRSLMEDAAKKGKLQELNNDWRTYASNMGKGALADAVVRMFGDANTRTLDNAYKAMETSSQAAFYNSISGKTVSDKERAFLRPVLPSNMNKWDVNLANTFFHTLVDPANRDFIEYGLMQGSDASKRVGQAVQEVYQDRLNKYLPQIRSIAAKGGKETASDKQFLDAMNNNDSFKREVLRKAFPDFVGKDLIVDDAAKNRKIHIFIPSENKSADKNNRDARMKTVEEQLKEELLKLGIK